MSIEEADKTVLTQTHVSTKEGLDDWRVLLSVLHARFSTKDFATGLRLVNRIGEAAEEANHHPDLDLRYPHLNVRLSSHDVNGLTQRDVRLARRISEIAAEEGVSAVPAEVQSLELALDTPDSLAVRPFWAAVLGLQVNERYDEVNDPNGALPALWFQKTDSRAADRQRFHLDITVPHDVAQQRIAAAIEAGGTLVSDAAAPAFWVLADPEGNKACVCTWESRD